MVKKIGVEGEGEGNKRKGEKTFTLEAQRLFLETEETVACREMTEYKGKMRNPFLE